MKKVLILERSPRRNGNSAILSDEFACSATDASYTETMLASLRGFTCCIPNAKEGGYVLGIGAMEAGEIRSSKAMEEACQLGRSVS